MPIHRRREDDRLKSDPDLRWNLAMMAVYED